MAKTQAQGILPSRPRHVVLKFIQSMRASRNPGGVSSSEWFHGGSKELGRGSFGTVYLASRPDGAYAVKVMEEKFNNEALQDWKTNSIEPKNPAGLSGGSLYNSPPSSTRPCDLSPPVIGPLSIGCWPLCPMDPPPEKRTTLPSNNAPINVLFFR